VSTQPRFLTLSEIIEIHEEQIERYGGDHGLRDRGLLESAAAMPAAGMRGEYFHQGLYEMAAAYLFYLCSNHPFVDGNKRVALDAAMTFLEINGVEVTAPVGEVVELTLAVATGRADKDRIAEFFRENSK
jgi:death-on-curing protein